MIAIHSCSTIKPELRLAMCSVTQAVCTPMITTLTGSAEAHGLFVNKPVGELLDAAKTGDLAASV